MTTLWILTRCNSSAETQIIPLLHWLLQQQELGLEIPALTWLTTTAKPVSLQNIVFSLQRHKTAQKIIIQANLLDSQNKSQKFKFEGNILSYNKELTALKIQFTLTLPMLDFSGLLELNAAQSRVKIQQATLPIESRILESSAQIKKNYKQIGNGNKAIISG
ncbi:MAG: hypothetical protein R3E08_02935 [Thiotrichaceae bacterium]